jgi:hypothetical protein
VARIRHQLRTFGPLLLISIGLFGCITALVTYVNIRTSLQQRTAASQGRIVSCHMESVSYYAGGNIISEDACRPTVHFTTTSGQEIAFVSSYTWIGFHQGDKVSVQYEPDHPQDALIVSEGLWKDVEEMSVYSGLPLIVLIVLGICWGYSSLRKRS